MSVFGHAEPATYAPFPRGRYVVPGPWYPLQANRFGNGEADNRVFQFDKRWRAYAAAKHEALKQGNGKYVCRQPLPGDRADRARDIDERRLIYSAVIEFIVKQLLTEYPTLPAKPPHGTATSIAFPSGAVLSFSDDWLLERGNEDKDGSYPAAMDALAEQLQEDVAIMRRQGPQGNSLLYTHVCLPSGWRPADKIGRPFTEVHAPVTYFSLTPGLEKTHLDRMIERKPAFRVRFVWSIQFDEGLNRHPDLDSLKSFDPARPRAWLRVERQTITGFPQYDAALFTIRVYARDMKTLCREERARLCSAIESMSAEQRRYKLIDACHVQLVDWIKSLADYPTCLSGG